MPTLNVFVSFEFDKDKDLQNNFYEQAKTNTQHRIKNCSLREAYPTQKWKDKARVAIRECDVVIVLIGEDTHNAQGVRTEVDMARGLGRPIFQVRPQKRPFGGLSDLEEPIPGKWKWINKKLDEISARKRGG